MSYVNTLFKGDRVPMLAAATCIEIIGHRLKDRPSDWITICPDSGTLIDHLPRLIRTLEQIIDVDASEA